jgi:hypothetical protein
MNEGAENMRKLGIVVVLVASVVVVAVADAGVARRQQCEDRYQNVFLAARQAVDAVGARVTHASESSGSVVGKIEADVYSHAMEINVWIDRSPGSGDPMNPEPIWVRVQARFKKIKERDLDEDQREQLKTIEDTIFGLIAARAACGPPS